MKGTEEHQDRTEGWIKRCDGLIASLEEAHTSLAKAIDVTLKEADEVPDIASLADNLEQRISKAIYLARGMASGMKELADRF